MTDSDGVTFEGPIPVTAASAPFRGASSPVGLDEPDVLALLRTHDYVEEEYFVSGIVDRQPYTTTLLVRKPRDPANFSGVVAIEPVHIQGALGLWQTAHPAILADGHIWATIGSQRLGVEGPIKTTDPARYATLNVPLPKDAEVDENALALARWEGDDPSAGPEALFANNPIANDILAQIGAELRSGGGPLAGSTVKFLILGGASQTGGQTLNFIKAAHAGARLPSGKPIYDAYLPMAASGWEPVQGGDAALIQIFAEGDLILFGSIGPKGYMAARADSDAPDDHFRCYQITGASHLPTRGLRELREIPPLGLKLEANERLLQFPAAPFYRAAFVNLVKWITEGAAPPHAPPIDIAKGAFVLDENGNAKGGLRSPYVDLPIGQYSTAKYVKNLVGVEAPFSAEKLETLYATRNKYLQRFNDGLDALVEARLMLASDAEMLKREEAQHPPL